LDDTELQDPLSPTADSALVPLSMVVLMLLRGVKSFE
jgi:hypothetical protein